MSKANMVFTTRLNFCEAKFWAGIRTRKLILAMLALANDS